MSLINDAIKQANKANKERSTPEAPAATPTAGMHAADGHAPRPAGNSTTSVILIAAMVVFVLLGGTFVYLAMRGSHSMDEPESELPKLAPKPATATASSPAPPAKTETSHSETLITDALDNPLPPAYVQKASTTPAATTPASPSTAAPTTVSAGTTAGPRPFPELKLQGIYYRLNNPSVMINGHTLEIGDLVDGAKVIQIERKSVTLELDGQQKILRLQ